MKSNHTFRWLGGILACAVVWMGQAAGQIDVTVTAAPGSVSIAPGQTVNGWFYDGQLPGPVIRVTEGQLLRVRFINFLPEESTIHWHGVPLPSGMDGIPGLSRPPVPPGQEFTYEFIARPSGTYFFHPHVGLQLDRGLYGVLIVDPAGPGDPPFDREYNVVLDDWLSGAPIMGQEPVYSTWLINGKTSAGQVPFIVNPGERVRLRFINASAGTHYVVSLDGHSMTVTHTDGQRVVPIVTQAIPIGAGERYDVIVQATNSGAWSLAAANIMSRNQVLVRGIFRYAGSPAPDPSPTAVPASLAAAPLLSYGQLAAAAPASPLSSTVNRSYQLQLTGSPVTYNWAINGQQWPQTTPLDVQSNEVVRLSFLNMSPHRHPMHLHGHFFKLTGSGGGTVAPLVKDTVLVASGPPNQIQVEMLADNPGMWMLHCHQLYHAEAGMMTMVRYINGDSDQDGLADMVDLDPLSAYPVLMVDDLGTGFGVGTTVELRQQWPQGTTAIFFAGAELSAVQNLGVAGILRIQPDIYLGSAIADATGLARLVAGIPQLPALSGLIIPLQGASSHPTLAPNLRLSTLHRLRIP